TMRARSVASEPTLARAEAQLGFELPRLLRRMYAEVADGGFGPEFGLAPLFGGAEPLDGLVGRYTTFASDPVWPSGLLPIVECGCATRWCLDGRVADGAIVYVEYGNDPHRSPFTDIGRTLAMWLGAWLDGAPLCEMEPWIPDRMGTNPFTRKPMVIRGRG